MNDSENLSHTTWKCKYHSVFIPKYRRTALYEQLRAHLGPVFRKLAEQKEEATLCGRSSTAKHQDGRFGRRAGSPWCRFWPAPCYRLGKHATPAETAPPPLRSALTQLQAGADTQNIAADLIRKHAERVVLCAQLPPDDPRLPAVETLTWALDMRTFDDSALSLEACMRDV